VAVFVSGSIRAPRAGGWGFFFLHFDIGGVLCKLKQWVLRLQCRLVLGVVVWRLSRRWMPGPRRIGG
jgi:hypothetical protein